MTRFLSRGGPALSVLAALALVAGGCGKPADPTGAAKATGKDQPVAQTGGGKAAEDAGNNDGWWCDEHGLPEEVCDLCSKKYREKEKAKGNWCEHGRVKTSCFKCTPGLQAKYAAEYQSKFGKAPPPTEADEKKAKDKG